MPPHHITPLTSLTLNGPSSSRCSPPPRIAAARRSGGRFGESPTLCFLPLEERVRLEDFAPRVSALANPVYYHFRKWRLEGRLRRAHDQLRTAVRQAEGRERDPSASMIDSQVVVKSTRVGGPERGYDGAKRLAGRKRHVFLVDTNGLVLAARVHGADLYDRDGGRLLVDAVGQELLPRMRLVWADGAYTSSFREWVEKERGWRVEVPYHRDRQLWRYGLEEKPRGFQVLPRKEVGGGKDVRLVGAFAAVQ